MKTLLLFFLTLFIVTGCGSQPHTPDKKPSWILNPNVGGKTGAVGVAGRTYDQKLSSQRKLAITRALDELSLQQGVRVEFSMSKKETLKNDRASLNMNSQGSYKTSSKITAHIGDIWQDSMTNELYVWMVID